MTDPYEIEMARAEEIERANLERIYRRMHWAPKEKKEGPRGDKAAWNRRAKP